MSTINTNDDNPFFIVELNGGKILNKSSFFETMERKMQFPESCKNKLSCFDDQITDLSWIPPEMGICILISDCSLFLSKDPDFKDIIMGDFRDHILPFWKDKVTECVKGGKPRKFYLIMFG